MKLHKLSLGAIIFLCLFSFCVNVDSNETGNFEILQLDLYNIKEGTYLINSEEELTDFFINDIGEKDPFYKLTTTEVILKKVDFSKESLAIVPRGHCTSYCEESIVRVESGNKTIIRKETIIYAESKPQETITTPHVLVIPKTASIEVKTSTKSG